MIQNGVELLNNVIATYDNQFALNKLLNSDDFNFVIERNSYVSRSNLFEMIAKGIVNTTVVIEHMELFLSSDSDDSSNYEVLKDVHIIDDNYNDEEILLYRIEMATCCMPLPGDQIVAVDNRDDAELGFIIHRETCSKIKTFKKFNCA